MGLCEGCVKWCVTIAVARIQFPSANQRHDETMGQKLAMKAKTERRIFCYLCCSKIIAKREVVGM